MNDDISRREWVVLVTGAGAVLPEPVEGAEADQQDAAEKPCPYFDQPLFCKGRKYCQ